MEFPADILDLREIKDFESLEVRTSNLTIIKLTLETTVSKESLIKLKSALLHHNIIPSRLSELVNYYEISGAREDLGKYSFTMVKNESKEELYFHLKIPTDKEQNANLLFETIKTYLELTQGYSAEPN